MPAHFNDRQNCAAESSDVLQLKKQVRIMKGKWQIVEINDMCQAVQGM